MIERAPLMVFLFAAAMTVLPLTLTSDRRARWLTVALVPLLGVVVNATGLWSWMALGLVSLTHAAAIGKTVPRATWTFIVTSLLSCSAGLCLHMQWWTLAFAASFAAIALRSGVFLLHMGISPLADRSPAIAAQTFATGLVMVFVHVRDVDHLAIANTLAEVLVVVGAVLTLCAALLSLVARDVRAFFRSVVMVHGGMLCASTAAAGRGHFAAALLVATTTCLAVSGLGLLIHALEARAGTVSFHIAKGRVTSYPLLAGGFAFFGAAGVGLPGTAGFVADDLFLHALWSESAWATAIVIIASALLAIGTLRALIRSFYGAPTTSVAPDLLRHERLTLLFFILSLIILGIFPSIILDPAARFLGGTG